MDLVREILLAGEALEARDIYGGILKAIDRDENEVLEHLEIMHEAGLVAVWRKESDGQVTDLLRLKWAGHEFLDKVRSDTIWARMKQISREKVGGLPFIALEAAFKLAVAEVGLELS